MSAPEPRPAHPERVQQVVFFSLVLALFVGAVGLSLVFGGRETTAGGVAVTIFPYYSVAVELLEGTDIPVASLLPRGESPHTYVPRPSDMERVEAARLIVADGLHDRALANLVEDPERLVELALAAPVQDALPARFRGAQHHDHDHGEHDHDHEAEPVHAWLDPVAMRAAAGVIAEALAAAFPEQAARIQRNRMATEYHLELLHDDLTTQLAPVAGRGIIAFHSAFDVMAERYGLEVIAHIEEVAGVAPTPRHVARLQGLVQRHAITALFVEPQLPDHTVRILAEELGLAVYTLDELGGGSDDYGVLMRRNARALRMALQSGERRQ